MFNIFTKSSSFVNKQVNKMPAQNTIANLLFFGAVLLSGTSQESKSSCPIGFFPCGNSSQCLERMFHCDSIVNCDNGADEEQCYDEYGGIKELLKGVERSNFSGFPSRHSCDIELYPTECRCEFGTTIICVDKGLKQIPKNIARGIKTLHLEKNELYKITTGTFHQFTKLKTLGLAKNKIYHIGKKSFKGLNNLQNLFFQHNSLDDSCLNFMSDVTSLKWLSLSYNKVQLKNISFPKMRHLSFLQLDHNKIVSIFKSTFGTLRSLRVLLLGYNKVNYIQNGAFNTLSSLTELDLSMNNIKALTSQTFQGLESLTSLRLDNNPVNVLPVTVFDPVRELQSLYLEGLEIENLAIRTFKTTSMLKIIHFKKFRYCSYAPHVRICVPRTDGLSSTEHLLVKPMLRICVWVVAAVTCIGNFLVLLGRFLATHDEPGRMSMLFIKNLSFADFLMGIYLCVVATKDIIFRNNYMKYAHSWMSSYWCVCCGILAMTASEVSVLILSFMSIERHFRIVNPFRVLELAQRNAYISMLMIWICGIVLALIPALPWLYGNRNNNFYGTNGLCFPLHISDPYLQGWQYSAFIFLGINFVGVLIIAVTYTSMYISIQRTRSKTPQRTGELEVAKRFFLIILTDCLCWIPIIILKILALCGVQIPDDLHAWIVIFILPVNSAMNPILYTLSSKEFKKKVKSFVNKSKIFAWLPSRRRTFKSERSNSSMRTISTKTSSGFGSVKLLTKRETGVRIAAAGPRRHTTHIPAITEDYI